MRSNPSFRVTDAITRPANTTTYTIGDVVTDNIARAFQFLDIANEKGTPFWLLHALLVSNNVPTVAGTFYLHLYKNPIVPAADNSAFAPGLLTAHDLLGTVIFDYALKQSAVTYYYASELSYLYCTPDPDRDDIFGVLTAGSSYVPASGEVIRPYLIGSYEV